jgi:Tfp pilus assembly protein PilO
MGADIAGGIMGEIKRHPYTSVSALMCLAICFVAMPFMWSAKADAGDVKALAAQIAEVRETVQKESTAGELSNVRRELFDISLRISTLERANEGVDAILYRRRDTLLAQQRDLEAKLQAMDTKN